MTLCVWHELHSHNFVPHVQYVIAFFAFFTMADVLRLSIFCTTIPILPPPFIFMGRFCLQMMDPFLIYERLKVISKALITQELIVYEAINHINLKPWTLHIYLENTWDTKMNLPQWKIIKRKRLWFPNCGGSMHYPIQLAVLSRHNEARHVIINSSYLQ